MGLFWAAYGWGGETPPLLPPVLKSVTHETWHSYTFPKEDPENI